MIPHPANAGLIDPAGHAVAMSPLTGTDDGHQAARTLLPGEKILWHGRPREGAGLRCLLRESDTYPLWAVGLLVLSIGAVIYFWDSLGFHPDNAIFMMALALALTIGRLIIDGLRLRHMRYVVTDRRAIAFSRRGGELRVHSVPHFATTPLRRETRCGTTIDLGKGAEDNATAANWERMKASSPGTYVHPPKHAPTIRFRALDPEQAPFDLLVRLSGIVTINLADPLTASPALKDQP